VSQLYKEPSLSDIREAAIRINGFAHRTPVMTSVSLNSITGSALFFKCENFQKVGAFKIRGATNSVFSLPDSNIHNGVATHSSGNFAQALALASRNRKIPAYIVMPRTAPEAKVNAVKGYGGQVIFCEPTLEARETTLEQVVERTGAVFLHPYNNYDVIAGQGTAALEFMTDYPDLDIIMAPVGGGGLISGTAIAAKSLNPGITVIAAEPQGADDAYRSKLSGHIIPSVNPQTIADGLLTSLGDKTFPLIMRLVDEIVTVSEDSIILAMKLIWERMKIIIEPSSAVPMAAILENQKIFTNKKVGIILSGGNLDLGKLPWS
jgi:threonine dehydratase